MKLSKVLIVHKKSTYQIQALEHKEPKFLKLLDEKHLAVSKVTTAHEEHYQTLDYVKEQLTKRGIEHLAVVRQDLKGLTCDADLVLSVGGDGTFLDTAHFLEHLPVLGVNSARSSSFGHFCLANKDNFAGLLDDIINDRLAPHPLMRLQLTLNNNVLSTLVSNEVLISHSNPAGTSRYYISVGDKMEMQRSSGIWVGPPAGSTGALRAAGGPVIPITNREYQYIVREPALRPGEHLELCRGILSQDNKIKIVSGMRTGALYIDGTHIIHRFSLGDELVIEPSKHDLQAFIDPCVNEMFEAHAKVTTT